MGRMATHTQNKTKVTARDRALTFLRQHPDGVSKSELRREIGGNAGAFRRLVASMEDKDEITIHEEHRPSCGLTKVVTAK
jgi:hypothetical protein